MPSEDMLLKTVWLMKNEFEYMKSHSARGCEFLSNIENAWNREYGKISYEICSFHHERYDGKGHPDGPGGDDIPISARIVSLAGVYDALVSVC